MKRTLIALTTLVLAAGCTSAASSPAHRSAPSTRQHTTVHHPTPHEPTVVISEKDAGHVVVGRHDHIDPCRAAQPKLARR